MSGGPYPYSYHYIKLCSDCGKVIEQCRCPDPSKTKLYDVCDDCKERIKKMGKEDFLNINNVEETIDKAIKTYFTVGKVFDALFWQSAVALLKLKLKGEKGLK